MVRRFQLILCLALLLIPGIAAAQYPVQQRLCDVAYQNCRTQIIDLINAETQTIDVAFWFMEDARYSNALINRFKAGVRVRVLFDTEAFTGKDAAVRQQIISDMAAAGIPLRYKSSGGILHWKLMVFGGQNIANFSAANFSGTGYVPNTAYQDYEDEVISFTTDTGLVNTFKSKYDDVWTTTSGYTNYANVTTLERYHATYAQDPRMNFPPYQNYATRMVNAIDAETVGIDIDMYRITDAKPADAILRAVQRGVPVRLYTEQEQYRDPTRLWHSYNVDRMYAAGVQVHDRQHLGLNHQKSVILKGQGLIVFGSSNWTSPSAYQQLEHNIFTTESSYYDFFVAQFNRKWDNTGPSPETKLFVPLPPDQPVYSAPANGASGLDTTSVTLKWNAGYWAHKYDIYVGTTPTLTSANRVAADVQLGPSLSASDLKTFTVSGPLVAGTTYYWKVVSKTMANQTADGPVWSFITAGTAPPGSGALPSGWSTADVGAVGATGSATYDSTSGQFVVSGSGADIWGAADEFRFVFTDLSGDGQIVARVAGLSNENGWTKAGVMMRESLADNSMHAMMVVSAGKGLAFQRRTATGGLSTSTSVGGGSAPYWVKLVRSGNTFTAYVSTDGSSWRLAASDTINMASTIKIGLALTSHVDGTLSTATFDNVTATGVAPPPPPSLPAGWSNADVGASSPAGSASFDSSTSTFSVSGAGADIWGTSDAFQFASTDLTGDGEIVARVATVQNVNSWTKAGVMMRDTVDAGSAHAAMVVTPTTTKGTAFQRRPTTGGTSLSTAGPVAAPPYWVKLVRQGTTFSAYTSPDGATWTLVGTQTITMGSTIKAGLVVSSHVNGTLATATFTNVTVTTY